MEKSLKSIIHTIKKYGLKAVVATMGLLALALIMQHLITFVLLAPLLGSMLYIIWRYDYV